MKGLAVASFLATLSIFTVWAGVIIPTPQPKETKLWTRSGKFEGDIVLSDALLEAITNRNSIFWNNTELIWPNSELVYAFSEELTQDEKEIFEDCLKKEFAESCVTIREADSSDDDYILVTTWDVGCYSDIGRQGGSQQLNLQDPGCYTCDTIVHEVLHALGFAHMQSDPTRDEYIYINDTNIQPKEMHNFDIHQWVYSYGVPYDYLSVMHYEWNSFAIDDKYATMYRHSEEDKYVLGNNIGMTDSDMEKLNLLYCQ